MSTSFTQVFGGTTIYPSDVSYLALPLNADIVLEWPLEATTGNNVVARIIDITPTGSFTVIMPSALEVGVGQTVLFNNLGPSTITIDNAAGNAILSIGAGEQWQAYLIDNTTVGGVWRTFRYGAAVAQAQAAALAGAGLVADGSELAQNYEVVDFSITPYSLTAPDRAKIFVWTGGLGMLNLPTAVAAGDGWFVQVRNGGQGDLTVDPSGSELVNAASTLLLQPGDSAVVVSDGIQWYTIGLGQQAVFAFDYTTIAVTGGTYALTGSELNRIAYKFNGTLTSNATIVVPATVQQYWVNNATTGAFTLGLQASGSSDTTLVDQNATAILYCDGTTIVPATTSVTFGGILPVLQGGTGANNGPSALANLGGTGIGTAVFTAGTTAAARTAIAAAASGANSDITSLTGLTTALSVGQGGTGAVTLTSGYLLKGNGTSAVSASVVYDNGSGNVGIGTSSPASKLEVAGTTTITNGLLDLSTGYSIRWGGAASGIYSGAGTADMVFTVGSSERMRVNGATGNVGIGTTSPTAKLSVVGNSNYTGTLVTTAGSDAFSAGTGTGTSTRVNALFKGTDATGNLRVGYIGTNIYGTDGSLELATNVAGLIMTLNNSGNVGIGTSSPTAKLNVSGGSVMSRFQTGSATDGRIEFAYNTTDIGYLNMASATQLELYGRSGVALTFGAGGTERMRIDSSGNVGIGTGPDSRLYVDLPGIASMRIGFAGGSENYFDANINYFRSGAGIERMRIDSTGNVGIGTSSPSYKLDVSGGASGTDTRLRVANAASNIFAGIFSDNTTFIGGTFAQPLLFLTNSAERMRIDASGNVLVGGTSNALGSRVLAENASGNQIAIRYTGIATYYLNATSGGDLGFSKDGTERMRIDASGNLLVGTTASSGAPYILELNTTSDTRIGIKAGNVLTGIVQATTNSFAFGTSGASTVMTFSGNGTERMRIDASGNVGIGTDTFGTSAAKVLGLANATAPTTSPAGMGQLYVEGGALKFRGSSGTVTTIAPA